MDRQFVDAQNLIEKYIRSELTGSQLDEFEIFLLENPDYLEEINAAEQLRATLRSDKESLFKNNVSNSHVQLKPHPVWAMAASVIIGVAVTAAAYFFMQSVELRSQVANLKAPRALTQEAWIDQTRGDQNMTLRVKPGKALLLKIEVGPQPSSSYSLRLRGTSTGLDWPLDNVIPTNDNVLSIYLSAAEPDDYILEVTSKASQPEETRHFTFTISN